MAKWTQERERRYRELSKELREMEQDREEALGAIRVALRGVGPDSLAYHEALAMRVDELRDALEPFDSCIRVKSA